MQLFYQLSQFAREKPFLQVCWGNSGDAADMSEGAVGGKMFGKDGGDKFADGHQGVLAR